MVTNEQIQPVTDVIVDHFKHILFGSYATETATEDTDIDVLDVK